MKEELMNHLYAREKRLQQAVVRETKRIEKAEQRVCQRVQRGRPVLSRGGKHMRVTKPRVRTNHEEEPR